MARIAGRNSWIAVPAGVACAAVVAALVWLSLPMVPVAVAWVGETLRAASTPRPAATAEDTPAAQATAGTALDCRTLYPDELWNEITWHGDALLAQNLHAPSTTVTALTDALVPTVRVTCDWRFESGGTIVSTLAVVGSDAATIAEPSLRSQGFACTAADDALTCARTQGRVVEEHVFQEGLWLSSVLTGWHPEDYGPRLAGQVWG